MTDTYALRNQLRHGIVIMAKQLSLYELLRKNKRTIDSYNSAPKRSETLPAVQTTNDCEPINNQRTDSPESRLEGNGLEVFTHFCSNLLKAFKIQNNLTIRQYYMQAYF